MLTVKAIWAALADVPDPEIPVVSLVEMGIIRKVALRDDTVTVTMTPTFSGCPALHMMRDQITQRLLQMGLKEVTIQTTFNPPWTSDWITESARSKLRAFGLAPPPRHGGSFEIVLMDSVSCPHCGSQNTTLRNSFGSTPCRMIYVCNACQEPFEQFKPL